MPSLTSQQTIRFHQALTQLGVPPDDIFHPDQEENVLRALSYATQASADTRALTGYVRAWQTHRVSWPFDPAQDLLRRAAFFQDNLSAARSAVTEAAVDTGFPDETRLVTTQELSQAVLVLAARGTWQDVWNGQTLLAEALWRDATVATTDHTERVLKLRAVVLAFDAAQRPGEPMSENARRARVSYVNLVSAQTISAPEFDVATLSILAETLRTAHDPLAAAIVFEEAAQRLRLENDTHHGVEQGARNEERTMALYQDALEQYRVARDMPACRRVTLARAAIFEERHDHESAGRVWNELRTQFDATEQDRRGGLPNVGRRARHVFHCLRARQEFLATLIRLGIGRDRVTLVARGHSFARSQEAVHVGYLNIAPGQLDGYGQARLEIRSPSEIHDYFRLLIEDLQAANHEPAYHERALALLAVLQDAAQALRADQTIVRELTAYKALTIFYQDARSDKPELILPACTKAENLLAEMGFPDDVDLVRKKKEAQRVLIVAKLRELNLNPEWAEAIRDDALTVDQTASIREALLTRPAAKPATTQALETLRISPSRMAAIIIWEAGADATHAEGISRGRPGDAYWRLLDFFNAREWGPPTREHRDALRPAEPLRRARK